MNRLKELRNERKYSTKQVEQMTGINSVSVTYYENEDRDINTNNLKIFSNLYQVSIDYILCNSNNGIYVFYENNGQFYLIDEFNFKKYLNEGFIYYKDHKRYIDLNKKINISKDVNISELLNYVSNQINIDKTLGDKEFVQVKVPIEKLGIVEKVIKLDDEKFNAISNMFKVL